MAKAPPSAQWTEPDTAAERPAGGRLVLDSGFYHIATTGPPDAYFTADSGFVNVDPSASSGRRITVVANRAFIRGA